MTTLLPLDPPISATNRVLNGTPDEFWEPVIAALRERIDLPAGPWHRLPKGKNVVITLNDEAILKLIPPYWAEDAGREAAALGLVQAGGPVETPTLLASDTLDGWTVLLMTRLPGAILSERWEGLSSLDRAELAAQLGAVAAWLHRIPVPASSLLAYDWQAHLDSEQAAAPQQFARDSAPPELQARWPDFLHSVGPLITPGSPLTLLHGDLSVANVVVQEDGEGRLRMTGLLDFGDASLGQPVHDWLSPGVHNFGGDPAVVNAFCDGYGLPASERTSALQRLLLARSVLYYGWRYLQHKFPLQGVAAWDEVAAVVWPVVASQS